MSEFIACAYPMGSQTNTVMREIQAVLDQLKAQEARMWNSMVIMRAAVLTALRAADPEIFSGLHPDAASDL